MLLLVSSRMGPERAAFGREPWFSFGPGGCEERNRDGEREYFPEAGFHFLPLLILFAMSHDSLDGVFAGMLPEF